MKLCRCPVCHSNIHLDALVNDDAARELLATLAPMDGATGRILMNYIGLFRPVKSDLSFNRALTLVNDTLALTSNRDWLRAALEETVIKLRAARTEGNARPLTNHNYLKKVLESISQHSITPVAAPAANAKPSYEITSYGRPESLAETKAKFDAQMAQFKAKAKKTKATEQGGTNAE
ncbi:MULTISPECIES: hypothetical protein [unclassified Shewanella]|uniref:hypothetical protein n=1 Tax=unclassified Shewanella TaxID=196818 RepID=UPI0021DA12FC|nr:MULTISPECIES: hypothetical protein [unclassified Shewanella]MCU8043318.1 hypothetical protein [Shewanella sp. SM68]MCU8047692.1 hypothetical protein [Shewanella sp. SM65]